MPGAKNFVHILKNFETLYETQKSKMTILSCTKAKVPHTVQIESLAHVLGASLKGGSRAVVR